MKFINVHVCPDLENEIYEVRLITDHMSHFAVVPADPDGYEWGNFNERMPYRRALSRTRLFFSGSLGGHLDVTESPEEIEALLESTRTQLVDSALWEAPS